VVGVEKKGKWGTGSNGQAKERGERAATMGFGIHGRE